MLVTVNVQDGEPAKWGHNRLPLGWPPAASSWVDIFQQQTVVTVLSCQRMKLSVSIQTVSPRLIRLVPSDFESAATLCLPTECYSDAILLAVEGSPELLQKTRGAYSGRCTTTLPYLWLFQLTVTDDLSDIVQNANQERQGIFVGLCSFPTSDEFASFLEQLRKCL